MLKGFKFTLFSAIFIIGAFISESLYIIYLNSKIEESADVAELIQKSGEALADADLNLKDELIYDYAILNANGEILRSNLSVQPPDFAFITLKFGGRVFFKRHFLHEGKLHFFVISKKISYAKIEFIAISTIFITIFVALIIALFNYKIIKNFYAQQSNLIKAFFNDAMHELKTPLGVALINTEMLGLRDKHTARIKSALKQMVITYEDVEYFIKSGKMSLKSRRIDMSEFLSARIKFHLSGRKKQKHKSAIANNARCERLYGRNLANAPHRQHPKQRHKILAPRRQDHHRAGKGDEHSGL